MDESKPIDATQFRHLTHEMNNSLAYVVTNLNLIGEELESGAGASPRMNALVADALEGSERLGELLRKLRRASWGLDPASDAAIPSDATPAPAPGELRGRILVVDDEEAILAAVRRALRSHEVVLASDAEQAWEMIREQAAPFDLVLCDLIMHGQTGIDLYRRLLEKAPETAARVVFMTAGGFTPEVRHFLGHVSNGVLHKPFDVKTLRWMVSSKLREHQARA